MADDYKLSSWDLYGHYRKRSAKELSLDEIGIQEQLQQAVKMPNALGKRNGHSLQGDFIEQILQGRKSFKNAYPLQPWWSYTEHPAWAIGGATISGQFEGGVIQQDGQYFLNGLIYYQLHDRFADPFDVTNMFEGEWNPGGEPFDINGQWQERVKIPITKEQFENFR